MRWMIRPCSLLDTDPTDPQALYSLGYYVRDGSYDKFVIISMDMSYDDATSEMLRLNSTMGIDPLLVINPMGGGDVEPVSFDDPIEEPSEEPKKGNSLQFLVPKDKGKPF